MSHILKLKRTKLKVYGWIREAEEELNMGYIPTDIKRICVSYAVMDDAFDYIGENIEISMNGKCVTKTKGDGKTTQCYGYFGINPMEDKCKYRWDILLKKMRRSDPIIIGIGSYGQKQREGLEYHYKCEYSKEGDTMSVIIDLHYGTISYSKNNMIQFFDNLIRDNWNQDTIFRLQIQLENGDDSAEITNISMLHRS